MLELLIRGGANINAHNIVGDAPLHKAALNGRAVSADYLIQAGANVNIRCVLVAISWRVATDLFCSLSGWFKCEASRRCVRNPCKFSRLLCIRASIIGTESLK